MIRYDNQAPVSNQTGTQYIYGNQYFSTSESNSSERSSEAPKYNLGLRLGSAPRIEEDDFVGRDDELKQLRVWLSPRPKRQNIVALHGMGGMGKTQLSVQYARKSEDTYNSVFWLNAKDESTLKAGLAALAAEVMEVNLSSNMSNPQEEERMIQQARQWLSQPDNEKWLVVYDNYDDPRLPGILSSTGYDIRKYFPQRSQGSILITTRSPRVTFGKRLELKKLKEIKQSLLILATRSGRIVNGDPDADTLAQRLDGLPLALATAGTYLSQTTDSFSDYLQLYNNSWRDLEHYSDEMLEYEDRTLYSTWILSFTRVQAQDSAAAELLRLLAYFDNQDLRYDLFQAGWEEKPLWWSEVVQSKMQFSRAMTKLHDYSLIEVGKKSYSLHRCVHDWTLEYLNRDIDKRLWRLTIHCVAQSVKSITEAEYWTVNRRLLLHVERLEFVRKRERIAWEGMRPEDFYSLAYLFDQVDMSSKAEEMYLHALKGNEKAWGADHTSTLATVNNLGLLYANQGKTAEAEEMYMRALRGFEKAWGADHTSTLATVNNLGLLYADQGKTVEAEEMYMRALRGYEKAWGADHTLTLDTVNNLGVLYADQRKIVEAEEMYMRALRGYEKAWGVDHTLTLRTVNNLGALYADQGKIVEAKEMYMRALRGMEKAWGADHTSTLRTVNNLGMLYANQGKTVEAEEMFIRALQGYKKACGPHHPATQQIAANLHILRTNLDLRGPSIL